MAKWSIAGWQPREVNRGHAHEFDARLLILEGAMTIASEGGEHTYRTGEIFEIPAGRPHSETAGPDGVRYLAGRRYQSASSVSGGAGITAE